MKLYADAPARRTAQLTGDALLVLWILGWILLARAVHGAVLLLRRPGDAMTSAGDELGARLRDAGAAVQSTPLVGDALRSPLESAGSAADQLSAAGRSQVEAVSHLAWWLALTIAAVPIVLALAIYVPRRWRFAREAAAAQRLVDSAADLDLFALRAMAHQPLPALASVTDDPVDAWRRGDVTVVRRLALLELRDLGLQPPD